MTYWRERAVLLGITLVVVGTPAAAGQAAGRRSTDSAGVRVVANPAARIGPPVFAMGHRLLTDIGGLHDDPRLELDAKTPYLTAVLVRDGIAIAEGTSLKVFGLDGILRWRAGSAGAGPGNFRAIVALCVLKGDSLVALDTDLRRATVYAPHGTLARTINLPGAPGTPGCLGDGSVIYDAGRQLPTASRRVRTAFGLQPLSQGAPRKLGVFPGAGYSAFPRYPTITGRGASVYVGDEDRIEVRVLGRDGQLQMIARTADAPEPISARARDSALTAAIPTGLPKARTNEIRKRLLATTEMPATWPSIERILVDEGGRFWVTGRKLTGKPREWIGFDASGQLMGRVEEFAAPGWSRVKAMQFAHDRVVLSARDEDGAPHVIVVPLVRR